MFAVNAGLGDAGTGQSFDAPSHEAAGPADIDVNIRRRAADYSWQVKALRVRPVVKMRKHIGREIDMFQIIQERGMGGGARAVMQRERLAGVVQAVGHGQQRGDADAAGEQNGGVGTRCEFKMITRAGDAQQSAWPDRMHRHGTAARRCVLQHADTIAVALRRIVHEGVLPDQMGGSFDINMRAGGEARQHGAGGIDQVERLDFGGFLGCRRDQKGAPT